MLTVRIHDRPTSWRSASTMPPTQVIGAAISNVHVMRRNICTCWTSFVMRVISDGAPKSPTSRAEKPVTVWKMPLRTSRPKAMAAFDPKYTAPVAATTCSSVTASITPPMCQM